jgi:LysM repeat protein
VGSWQRLGQALGLLVLVATLTAASAPGGLAGPAPAAVSEAPSRPSSEAPSRPSSDGVPASSNSGGASVSSESAKGAASVSLSDVRPFVVVHVVARGETVSAIAAGYGVKASTVATAAKLDNPDHIYPGETLVFPSVDGLLHVVKPGDTLSEIAQAYRADSQAILRANAIDDPKIIPIGRTLIVPGGTPRRAPAAPPAATTAKTSATATARQTLSWPVSGSVSSRFGPRWGSIHAGVDIAAAYGATIRAAAPGRVAFVGWYGRYGRCVVVDHGGGFTTLYGHVSVILVSTGERVGRGDPIAEVGSSGKSTGPHCHFEVRVGGRAKNPLNYLGD